MSDKVILKIPIKLHLKKYILRKFQSKEDIIPLSTDDPIGLGIIILNIICKKTIYLLNFNEPDLKSFIQHLDWNYTLNLLIGPRYRERSGLFINEDKIFYINKFIEKQFKNELCIFIHANYLYNPKFVVEYGIDDFISHYGINEDDIIKESLIKFYHRNKNTYSYSF